MQIVINIPKEVFNQQIYTQYDLINIIAPAIHNGTVLPKHGRLIDVDKLLVHEMYGIFGGREKSCVLREDIEDASTILEADMFEPQESEDKDGNI